jgi:hypothetical protein
VEPWLVTLLVVAGLAVLFPLAQRFGWIDLSNKRKSSGNAGVMGIGDEVFHPTRHEAQIELDRQTVLPAPAPLPGDGDKGIYEGQVRIDLTERAKHRADDVSE